MKSFLLSILILSANCLLAQVGFLDLSFSSDGIVTTAIPNTNIIATSVALQSDEKIVSAGYIANGTSTSSIIIRYNNDGAIDSTFDFDGIVNYNIHSRINCVAIQTDGKILLAGTEFNNTSGNDFLVFRLNTDGSFDNTFGTNGIVVSDIFNSNGETIYSLQIQNDGKILVGGSGGSSGLTQDFSIARFNDDGTIDSSFDFDGKATFEIEGGDDFINSIALQNNGQILVAGPANTENGFLTKLALIRLNNDGSIDSNFSNNGISITASGIYYEPSISVQSDGKIIASGTVLNNTEDFFLIRFNSNGVVDSSFGVNGIVVSDFGGSNETAYTGKIQSDDKILVAGYHLEIGSMKFIVARYDSNGNIDNSFGTNGFTSTEIGSNLNIAHAIGIQNDGKIILAGVSASVYREFTLVRYNNDTSIDLKDNNSPKIFNCYPNPIQNSLTINSNKPTTIIIINILGKEVLKCNIKETTAIDLSHLEPGIYFIKDFSSQQIQKIIKQL